MATVICVFKLTTAGGSFIPERYTLSMVRHPIPLPTLAYTTMLSGKTLMMHNLKIKAPVAGRPFIPVAALSLSVCTPAWTASFSGQFIN